MRVEIKIPSFGESVVEATVGKVLKPSGSTVQVDEEILELETDKLNQALFSPAAGKVELRVKAGDVVKVGEVIGWVDSDVAKSDVAKAEVKTAERKKPEEKKPETSKTLASAPSPSSLPPIRKKVDEAVSEIQSSPATPSSPSPSPLRPSGGKGTRRKMSKLRRVIAERLVQVKNQTAMLTTFNELDMSAVIAVRERERENFEKKHGVRLGLMSFFIKAAVAALEEFPEVNSQIEGDEIIDPHRFDISVAVSTDKGLMVPVIPRADQLSYAEIEKKLKELAEKARSGTISIDELQGGTFTITNAGLFGSLLSTPILNPPQSAILGMHNIVKRPVALGDEVVIRPMMYLALSYDHRIIDGKEAVLFLMHIKKNLEEPARLLLDL